ncbi:MAG: peptide ABC transporter substrate-binding protein [Bdellovibrionota bacterium]
MNSRIFLSLLAATVFITKAPLAKAVTNEELKIGVNQEFETLNPIIATTVAAKYMLYFAYRTLVYLDIDGQWKTQMLKEIPSLQNKKAKIISKNGKKFLETKIEIIETAKWGDGTPVTCKDLKLTVDIGRNTNVSIANREAYTDIEDVVWDEKTPKKCVVTFNKLLWNFYQNLPDVTPAHIEQAIFDKWGKEKEGYDRNTMYTKNPKLPGLYNGPYLISEVTLGSHLIYVPNPHFYGTKPKIKKIILRILPNTGTLEANLRSNTVDMIASIGMSFDQALIFDEKIKTEKLPYNVLFKSGTVYQHLDVNLDSPNLKDIRVRQALMYGLKKDDIMKSIFENKATNAIHWITPDDAWFTDDPKFVVSYKFDKKKAKSLLDEAGWTVGKDGYRFKDGQKLTLKMAGAAGVKLIDNIQAILQSQWKDIGIEILLKNEPGRVLFSETIPKRRFDLAIFSWSSNPEQSPESTFHSKNIPTEKNSWSGQNDTGWNNPKVDLNIEKLKEEFDPKKRKALIAEMIKAYTSEIPVIPLFFRPSNAVVPKNMKGFSLAGHQFYESYHAEKWDLQ